VRVTFVLNYQFFWGTWWSVSGPHLLLTTYRLAENLSGMYRFSVLGKTLLLFAWGATPETKVITIFFGAWLTACPPGTPLRSGKGCVARTDGQIVYPWVTPARRAGWALTQGCLGINARPRLDLLAPLAHG